LAAAESACRYSVPHWLGVSVDHIKNVVALQSGKRRAA